ncbi:hypothetical protein ACQ7B3_23335, partial [Escherichia coli]|uniref:hypothetical protein n=1 Tax=Escherichia coli TaxID=562 RepID=UPI003D32C32D
MVDGGRQTVVGGGRAPGTLINSGERRVARGGRVINTTVNGGRQTVVGGGSVSGTLINNGEQRVSSG